MINKHIEHALANQVYSVIMSMRTKPTIGLSVQKKDGIHDTEAISSLDMIKEIMQSGVSPLTVIEVWDEKKPLISHVFSATANQDVLNIFIDTLKKEHIENLDERTVLRMYYALETEYSSYMQTTFLKKAFECGFNFTQGKFNEARKAEQGDQGFFELCLIYKPDFKFNFKYDDGLYLDELVKKELDSLDKLDSDYKKKENLFIFLKKAREVHALKTSLTEELPVNNSNKSINKI